MLENCELKILSSEFNDSFTMDGNILIQSIRVTYRKNKKDSSVNFIQSNIVDDLKNLKINDEIKIKDTITIRFDEVWGRDLYAFVELKKGDTLPILKKWDYDIDTLPEEMKEDYLKENLYTFAIDTSYYCNAYRLNNAQGSLENLEHNQWE